MSITLNAKGTSVPSFTIGKGGTTIYQGSVDPSSTYTMVEGDYWLNKSINSLNVWSVAASDWQAPRLADLHFVDSSIVAPASTNLTLSVDTNKFVNIEAGTGGPGLITATNSQDIHINPAVGGGQYLVLCANRWPAADGTNGQTLITNGSGVLSWISASGTGTVTSIGGTGTVSGLTLTGTVTSSGNLTLGGTLAVTSSDFSSQTANTFLAAPNSSAGTPTFRTIVSSDIPTLNQNTTGNATSATNIAGGATGSLPYQSSANTTTMLAAGTNGYVLTLAGGVPTWADTVTPTGTQTLTNKTLSSVVLNDGYTEEVFTVTGTTPALSPVNGSIQIWSLTANSTPTLGTWAAGQSITLMVDDGTARTITWTTVAPVWKTNGGVAPTLNTTGYTVITFWKVGTTIYGARVGDA